MKKWALALAAIFALSISAPNIVAAEEASSKTDKKPSKKGGKKGKKGMAKKS